MTQLNSSSNESLSLHAKVAQSDVKEVFDTVLAFSPNRDTMGGTSYLILSAEGNILIDSPPWNEAIVETLEHFAGIQWMVFTHRGGMGNPSHIQRLQDRFQCNILVQEQEAYLLPDLNTVSFQHERSISSTCQILWTPGHSPGSACVYYKTNTGQSTDGGVLFSGRHLLPNGKGQMLPIRVAKTFHWFRQLRSVAHLRERFTRDTLAFGCPGANTGFLRRQRMVPNLYEQIADLDLDALRQLKPGL